MCVCIVSCDATCTGVITVAIIAPGINCAAVKIENQGQTRITSTQRTFDLNKISSNNKVGRFNFGPGTEMIILDKHRTAIVVLN